MNQMARGCAQLAGHVFEPLDRLGALAFELLRLRERAVPDDDPVAAAQQTPGHVAAHAAKTDHRQFHVRVSLYVRAYGP